jgi:hypothetical protein
VLTFHSTSKPQRGMSRIQCMVISDTVNLASRIEQLTKIYSARFLIGEHAFKTLKDPEALAVRSGRSGGGCREDRSRRAVRNHGRGSTGTTQGEEGNRRLDAICHAKILRSGFYGGLRRVRGGGTAGSD